MNEPELIYPDTPLIFDKNYQRYLLKSDRDGFVDTYIEENFHEESWEYQWSIMLEFPFFANKLLDDFDLSDEEKYEIYFRSLVHKDQRGGRIVLVDGAFGGGKTGFGCWSLDEYHKRRTNTRYYFVTKADIKPKLPSWVKIVNDIKEVENNSVALIDEGGMQLSARRHSTKYNKDVSDRLVILRHKGITLLILVQNIKMVDVNVRRLADIRVLKHGILFGTEENTSEDVKLLRNRLSPRNFTEAYIEIPAKRIFMRMRHPLPEWFDEQKTSKSFSEYKFKEEPVPQSAGIK